MADDTWGIIDKRVESWSSLYKRMDVTKSLIYMDDFKLTDYTNKEIKNVVNVTGNKGASFGSKVIANLMMSEWQTVVEGKISPRSAHIVEQFLDDSLDQANEYVRDNYDIADIFSFLYNHICNRGLIGLEYISTIQDGIFNIHCVPLDMRWTPFVRGKWVAPITFRDGFDLEAELEMYEKIAKDGKGGEYFPIKLDNTSNIEVRDYWDNKKEELLVDKKLVFAQEHRFGKPPFVIRFAPSGFMLRDRGYIEHEGEDIYFLIRKLDKELNRSLSIDETIAFEALYPAYAYEEENFNSKPARDTAIAGETMKVPKGEIPKVIEKRQLNQASMIARQDILRMVDEGAPSQPRAYTQPPSAIEVSTEQEIVNQLQNPSRLALQMLREQLFRMMIDQFILVSKSAEGEGNVAIGRTGKKSQYSVAHLKDPDKYSIKCQLMTKSTRLDIVNESRALAMWGKAPLKYILSDILSVKDPAGWERALDIEQAKNADPVIGLSEMGIRYAEEADEMEDESDKDTKNFQSMLLIERAVAMLKQRLQPQVPQLPQEAEVPKVEQPKGNANPLVALTGQGGMLGGGSQPRQPSEVV